MIETKTKYNFCPGCGHKAFCSVLLTILQEKGLTEENTVFVSGIGCGGIVATTLNADVIKTSHGRPLNAARTATLIYPQKLVIVISGDGDLVNIGGNALIHTARKKNDFPLLCICLDNTGYSMTGGQQSATNLKSGFNLKNLLYDGCEIDFFAQTSATNKQHLREALEKAIDFIRNRKSLAFVQVGCSCPTHKVKGGKDCAIWEREEEE